jgi:hypothetical protein
MADLLNNFANSRKWVGWRSREADAAVLPLPAPGRANTGNHLKKNKCGVFTQKNLLPKIIIFSIRVLADNLCHRDSSFRRTLPPK